jgi:hypothetical protein
VSSAVGRDIDATCRDEMIRHHVVEAAHAVVEYLQIEPKRVPNEVLFEAERLECLLCLGYDPHFEGDSPLVSNRAISIFPSTSIPSRSSSPDRRG